MTYVCTSTRILISLVFIFTISGIFECGAAASHEGVARTQQKADELLRKVENINEVADDLAQANSPSQAFQTLISQQVFDAMPGIDTIRQNAQSVFDLGELSRTQQDELREWHGEMAEFVQQYPALSSYVERFGSLLDQAIGAIEEYEQLVEQIDNTVGEVSEDVIQRINTQLDKVESVVDTMSSLVEVLAVIPGMQANAVAAASVLTIAKTGITLVKQAVKANPKMIKAACHMAKISMNVVKSTANSVKNWFVGLLKSGNASVAEIEGQIAPEVDGAQVNTRVDEPDVATNVEAEPGVDI